MVAAAQPLPVLRQYQGEAVAAAERGFELGLRSQVVEMATGTGKTTVFGALARRFAERGERTLVLAGRRELVDQAAARLRSFGLLVTVERGGVLATGREHIVCSTVQAMRCRLLRFRRGEFGLVVMDECQHAPARGWLGVAEWFCGPVGTRALRLQPPTRPTRVSAGIDWDSPRALLLGVTATPDRADGVSLGMAFVGVAYRFGVREAVEGGYLVRARGVRVEVAGLDLSSVRSRPRGSTARAEPTDESTTGYAEFRDLDPKQLGRAAIAPEAVRGIAGPLLELAGDRRTIVFAVDRRHARALAAAISARAVQAGASGHGAVARTIDGSMRAADRAAILAAHRAGEFQILVNVSLLCEGYDDPAVACVALCRPTQSRILVAQECGRALRPDPNALVEGRPEKTEALIIDFTSSTATCDLVGPEDVLTGAMVGPVERVGDARPALALPEEPVEVVADAGGSVRWTSRAVQLIRGAGRSMRRGAGGLLGGLWRALAAD